MHRLLNQTSSPFNSHQQKQYNTGSMMINHHHHPVQQYCPPSSIQHQTQQYNNYHHRNPYSQETSTIYHSDPQIFFSNHSLYDSNNNYPDHQQYGLLRPAIESEHYPSYYSQSTTDNEQIITNENLINNLNHHTPHYTDLTAMTRLTNDRQMEKHYDFADNKEDDQSSLLPNSNENNFHLNQTTTLTTQW
jgi:hypothetical protein